MMEQQIAVVTGASGCIGSTVADRLEKDGFRVWRISHSRALPCEYTKQCRNPEDAEAIFEEIYQQENRLDVLVNCAGAVSESPALMTELDDWRKMLDANLMTAFVYSRAAGKYMLLGRYGRIVHLSSVAARFGGRGEIAYASAKAGLEAMVRVLALELGRRGITVNAIAPGVIESEMTASIRREYGEALLERIAARRFGQPDEIASAVAFLTGKEAAYINGQVIAVDGGMGLG